MVLVERLSRPSERSRHPGQLVKPAGDAQAAVSIAIDHGYRSGIQYLLNVSVGALGKCRQR